MTTQKWADAATQNCVWLLQIRDIPNGCYKEKEIINDQDEDQDHYRYDVEYELNEESLHDGQCWTTDAVFLNRLEAFEAGARRIYHYGQYGKDWRIYGVPAKGQIVELLANSGVNQELIDKNVKEYEVERKLWEAKDERIVAKSR